MGSYISKGMEETMNKQFEKQVAMQQVMLERQIQNMNFMREQQMAMQIARSRDLFHYWTAFYSVTAIGCTAGFIKTKKPGILVPLIPFSFIVTYFGDMAYGSKMTRIRTDAQSILREENHLVDLPVGTPTLEYLDYRRYLEKQKE